MKRIVVLLSFLLVAHFTNAQQENTWVLGNAGIDFNGSAPATFATGTSGFGESGTSVSDKNGQLLFYTDGSQVWNRNFALMTNGSDLTGLGNGSTGSSSQGTLIVPIPGSSTRYYILSLTSFEMGINFGRLYYSTVDMDLNSGLGDILPGQKGILVDSNLTEKLAGVPGLRCNIWIICRSRSSSTFKSFEVTETGINVNPVLSNTGLSNFSQYMLGDIVPSPDYKKLLSCNAHPGGGGLELFDFDQDSGTISNPVMINDSLRFYSACFSPDQSKVYGMSYFVNHIYQFDLSNLLSISKTYLGPCGSFDKIKLAPDDKIYFRDGATSLGRINFPNLAGPACNYNPSAILFNFTISGTLPNIVPILVQDTANSITTNLSAGCWQSSVLLDPDIEGWNFLWDNGSTGTNRSVTTPGIYTLSYKTPPCISHKDTFVVGFPNGILPSFIIEPSCKNDQNGSATATTFAGDTVQYFYTWLNEDSMVVSLTNTIQNTASGIYTIRVRTHQCDTTLLVNIPEVDYKVGFLADTLICTETSQTFQNTSDTHFLQYSWDFGDQSNSNLTAPNHSYTEPGLYTVSLIGIGPVCTDTAKVTITVDDPVNLALIKNRDSICTGQNILLSPQTDNTTTSLRWSIGTGEQLITGNESLTRAFDVAGVFPVTLHASFRACPDQETTDTAHIYPMPLVDLGPDTALCVHGQGITLSNNAPSDLDDHYKWNTGAIERELIVKDDGIFSLTVTNKYGCATTESVTVYKNCYIDIPNAFSPNMDGENDYFFPRQLLSRSLSSFRMKVLDRWGQLIFETAQTSGRGWDGKLNGKDQPVGVYVYLIDLTTNGRQEYYQGNVTLVR